jgi:hypothetical protein
MKLLISSTDFDDLARVVNKLVWAYIPCAVCRDPVTSGLSVWIQQDIDFPLAVHVTVNRDAPRRLPHWARVYESSLPRSKRGAADAAHRMPPGCASLAESKWPSRAEAARAAARLYLAKQAQVARLACWPFPGVDLVAGTALKDQSLA